MSPLPLFKLGSLLVKTIAKPVAKQIKEYAQEHPRFRGLCVRLGRAIHYTTTHLEVNLRQGRIIQVGNAEVKEYVPNATKASWSNFV